MSTQNSLFVNGAWDDLLPVLASYCGMRDIKMFSICCKSVHSMVESWYSKVSVSLDYYYVDRLSVSKRYKQSLEFQNQPSLTFVSLDPVSGCVSSIVTAAEHMYEVHKTERIPYWTVRSRQRIGWLSRVYCPGDGQLITHDKLCKTKTRVHAPSKFKRQYHVLHCCSFESPTPFTNAATSILYTRRPGKMRRPFEHSGYYLLCNSIDEIMAKIPKNIADTNGYNAIFMMPVRLVPK